MDLILTPLRMEVGYSVHDISGWSMMGWYGQTLLPLKSPALYYIQRLRDEAHRFANGAHRTRRSMDIKKNPLDEIEGVGPGRKKALLHAFGSAKGVGRAAVVDLVKVEGINQPMAERIYAFFHPET